MRLIWLKIIATFGARTYGIAIEFATLLVTARILGPDGRGIVATITAWAALFAATFGLSLGQVIVYRLTDNEQENQFHRTFSALLPVSFFLVLGGWLCAYTIYFQTETGGLKDLPEGIVLLGFSLIPLMIWDTYCSHLLSARGRLQIYNRGLIWGRTIGFGVMLSTILLFGRGVYSPILGNMTSLLLIILIAIYGIRDLLSRPLKIYASEIINLLGGGLKLHINTIGSYLLMTVDIIILSQFRGVEEVGWYQAAMQFIAVPLMLPAVITMVLFSKIAEEGPDHLWAIHRQLIWQIMALIGAVALAGYFLAPVLIPVLLGNGFTETIPVFRILLLAMIGMCFSQLMVSQWITRGLFLQASIITITVGITNVILNFTFIPMYGIHAAAWTTVGAFSISILSNGIFALLIENKWKNTQVSTPA